MGPLAVNLAAASLAAVFAVAASFSPERLCTARKMFCRSHFCSSACASIDIDITEGNFSLCNTTSQNPPSGCGLCTTPRSTAVALVFTGSSCLNEQFNDFLTNGVNLTALLARPPTVCSIADLQVTLLSRLSETFCTSSEPAACATNLTCPASGCILDDIVCPCDAGNIKNCGDFPTQELAQECFEKCGGSDSDVHRLDGNSDGVACNSNKKCLPPGPVQGSAPFCAGGMTCPATSCFVSDEVCPCTLGNTKNCGDFPTKELAQACFAKCNVHGLDGNGDGVACQSRPACAA